MLTGLRPRDRRPAPDTTRAVGDAVALDELRLRVAGGAPPTDLDALPARARRAVAVAEAVGAPVLDAIDAAQAADDDLRRAARAVDVASAQTKAVAAGLVLAPLALVPALGRLAGADLVGFYGSGLGLLVLAVGTALLAAGAAAVWLLVRRVGRAWRRPVTSGGATAAAAGALAGVLAWRVGTAALAPPAFLVVQHLVARRIATPAPRVGVDEAAELTALALRGGLTAPAALRVAADELPGLAPRLRRLAFGLELGMRADDLDVERRAGGRGPAAVTSGDPLLRLVRILATAEEVGAPAAPSLRRLAADLRAADLARVLAAAERLPAHLTFPTALCLLPGTVLLVAAPIVHAGLGTVGT